MPSDSFYFDEEMAAACKPRELTCKYCHTPGLWWFPQRRDSYFLKNPDGTQHNCMRIREPASLDEFTEE